MKLEPERDAEPLFDELLKYLNGTMTGNNENIRHADPQNCVHASSAVEDLNIISPVNVENVAVSEDINSSVLPGSVVILAGFVAVDEVYIRKNDNHIKYINLLDMVNTYCLSALPITRPLENGEIVAVKSKLGKCFYRGKVIKKINHITYQIEWIDFVGTVDTSIFNILEIPKDYMVSSNCIRVALKGFNGPNSRPLDLVAVDYINDIIVNCTPIIIEFSPGEDFKNVILKLVDGESINKKLYRLINDKSALISDIVNKHGPEKVSKQEIHMVNNQSKLTNGDLVNIVTFIDVHNIYVRKIEDENDVFFNFIDKFNLYCSTATPIGKLPKVNDIVGVRSLSDGLFYRAKVLKKIDEVRYKVQFIDYGVEEIVHISVIAYLPTELKDLFITDPGMKVYHFFPLKSPFLFYSLSHLKKINHITYQIEWIDFVGTVDTSIFNIFESSKDYMISSNCIRVALKGFNGPNSRPLDLVAVDYINDLIVNRTPIIIEFSPGEDFKNVILKLVDGESINEKLYRLINDNSTLISDIVNKHGPENVSKQEIHMVNNQSKLTNGDLVNIVTFIDVHNIYVRKIEDENDDFFNFIDKFNLYCSTATPIGKLPKVNDIVGVRSLSDGLFYRAKVLKKIDEVRYKVQFIDYGVEEIVHLSVIAYLPTELKDAPTTIRLLKLKDIPFCKLNDIAYEYVNLISENQTITVEYIEEGTSDAILKSSENQYINSHLRTLIFGSNEKENLIST